MSYLRLMKNSLKILGEIADSLYNPELHYQELFNGCQTYKSLLLEITAIKLEEEQHRNDIYTDAGRAVGTEWAIRCVEDIMRTRAYSSAVYQAVKELNDTLDRPVRLIYAGTGPFATLVLPLITRFSPEELQLDLLEINPESAAHLKQVLKHFEAEAYVREFAVTDATTYQITDPEGVDILMSETMQAGLAQEHQVAICYNLLPQLSEHTVLIPEKIALKLYAVNQDKQHQHKLSLYPEAEPDFYTDLGTLFTLDRQTVMQQYEKINAQGPEAEFDAVDIEIPKDTHRKHQQLSIATQIFLYKDIELKLEESGLTALRILQPLNPMMRTVKNVRSRYYTGEAPGLDFELNV